MLTTFNSISSTLYNYRFAFTSSPEVMAKLKCKKNGLFLYRAPKFVSVKDGDRPRERFPSDTLTQSAVANWIAAKAQPLVGQFSHSTKERYKNPTLIIFMNLDFDKNAKVRARARARNAASHLFTYISCLPQPPSPSHCDPAPRGDGLPSRLSPHPPCRLIASPSCRAGAYTPLS